MKSRKLVSAACCIVLAGAMCALPASAKTVVRDMLPQEEWSSESTMIPVQIEGGWKLKTSPTMDGGNAVSYFDMTYHKGQMIAYDFTIVGGEEANVTINIGFVRGLEESEYPNGNREFLFTQHLAEALGIEASGENNETLPGGTYKGVLDPGDFFFEGFDKFQHVAFYVGGEEAIIREFAFVSGVEAGAETYPTKEPTTTAPPTESNATDAPDASADQEEATSPADGNSSTPPSGAESPNEAAGFVGGGFVAAGVVVAGLLTAVVVMAVMLAKKKKNR